MSYPTVHAKPFFDTAGDYVSVYVDVMNNPPPGTTITKIRIWAGSTDGVACVNRRTMGYWMDVPNPVFSGTPSLWSDYFPSPPPNMLWDDSLDYFAISVEVNLSMGPGVFKGGVWEQVRHGDYPPLELADCSTTIIAVPKSAVIVEMTGGDLRRLGVTMRVARKTRRAAKGGGTRKG